MITRTCDICKQEMLMQPQGVILTFPLGEGNVKLSQTHIGAPGGAAPDNCIPCVLTATIKEAQKVLNAISSRVS